MVTKYLSPKITKSHSVKKSEIFYCVLNFEVHLRKRKNLRKRRVYAGFGADSRTRTDDLRITNALLYQLSHISITCCVAARLRLYYMIILYFAEKIKRKIATPAQKQNRTAGLTKSPAIWKKRISQRTHAPGCDLNCQIGKYRSALDPARKSRSKPCPPAYWPYRRRDRQYR